MIFVVIVLDNFNEVKTNYIDFVYALKHKKDGIRCCLDIGLLVYEYTSTQIDDFKIIPLDEFTCKRTIVGTGGTNINIESSFGLTNDDYLYTGFKEVELDRKHHTTLKGLLISNTNHYFSIINQLCIGLGMVNAGNTNSFVLDECDLSELQLIPFNLKYADGDFVVSDVEQEMATSEYDAIVEDLYCEDYAL